jgi:hypothetical protein
MSLLSLALVSMVLAACFLLWSVHRLRKKVRKDQAISVGQCVLLTIPLIVLDGFMCLFILISAALGHSQAEKALVPVKCLLASILVVLAPLVILLVYRHFQSKRHNLSKEFTG